MERVQAAREDAQDAADAINNELYSFIEIGVVP